MKDNSWARILAYVTGLIDQELLLRNEYLAAENRILRAHLSPRLRLTDPERSTLAEIGKRIGRKALKDVACVAKPDTILTWYRRLIAKKPATQVTTDSGITAAVKPAIQVTADSVATPSAAEPHRGFIEEGLARGRNAMGIWQELVDQRGFAGSYESVKRFVRKQRGNQSPEARAVILTAPGEEAQVDYGTAVQCSEKSIGNIICLSSIITPLLRDCTPASTTA